MPQIPIVRNKLAALFFFFNRLKSLIEQRLINEAGKGWLGITDKYWITSQIPEKYKEFKADFEFKNKFKANFIETKPTSVGANEIKSNKQFFPWNHDIAN